MKIEQKSKRPDRVHDILKRISKTPLTMSELAKIYGVSTKTIQRDFNEHLISCRAIRKGRKWSKDIWIQKIQGSNLHPFWLYIKDATKCHN